MIRTRWLVAAVVSAIALIAIAGNWAERARSEAGLADLGAEQATVARAAALAFASAPPASFAVLEQPGVRVFLRSPAGEVRTPAGAAAVVPGLAGALARGDRVLRVDRSEAASLGLPARTAMVGLASAPGAGGTWTIAVAASAEHQRDRDFEGQHRLVWSLVLASALIVAFGAIAWKQQRAQLDADVARTRDAELERLGRAATMAALASGVAHELSTPLGVIVGRAEQLRERAAGDDRNTRAAQTIIDQADHIDRVVRGLLGLARGAPIALVAVAPDELVAQAVALVEHRFARAQIRLTPAPGGAVQAVLAEPRLLVHAIVNLLLNACDAATAEVGLAVAQVGDQIEIAVTDDGVGITAADAARATEPFFTTKPAGSGTGLGLAIVHEIASTHRGAFAIAPRSPRGTRATIRIPVAGAEHG